MAETTIEWTRGPRGELGYTFNGWIGCEKISPGCDNCYAAAQDKFRGWTPEGWGGPRRRTSEANWKLPERWNDAAGTAGERRRVFCSSLADVFDNQVDPQWRKDLFRLIEATPNLDWLLLTKRIGNARSMSQVAMGAIGCMHKPLPPNVWLGATVVNQEEADRDVPKLLATPARVRFLSMEPLLGPVDLRAHLLECCGSPVEDTGGEYMGQRETVRSCCGNFEPTGLHWVIVGGESGHGARPMHPDWARSLRDQCATAGVPFLFKQWGEWMPIGQQGNGDGPGCSDFPGYAKAARCVLQLDGEVREAWPAGAMLMRRIGKKAAGRLLDGVTHNGFPEVS